MASVVSKNRRDLREDLEPWYKQFWPWFLIALPATVVVAGFATLYIANKHSDDLVVTDYYKDGLAINRQLEKQARAAAAGLTASLLILDDRIQVRLYADVDGSEVGAAEQLRLRLSHPLEADRDFTVLIERVAPQLFVGAMPALVEPNWHWTLEDTDASWRLDGSLGNEAFLGATPSRRG
jgi:hypothetical protein